MQKPASLGAAIVVAALVGALASARSCSRRRAAPAEPARAASIGPRGDAPAATHAGAVRALGSARVEPGPPRTARVDARRTGRSPFRGPTSPTLVWSFDAGSPIEAAPALLDEKTAIVATLGGALFAVDLDSGKARWKVDLGDRAYASPLVLDGAIFAGSDAKRLVRVGERGAIAFSLATDGEVDTALAASPRGGLVATAGRTVYGVSTTGTIGWRFRARRKIFSSPAIAPDGTVYFGAQDDHLYALHPDGTLAWSTNLGGDVDAAPAVADDGTVYAGSDAGAVFALDPATGSIRGRTEVGGFVRSGLSLTRTGLVVAGVYGPAPRVVAIDPASFAIAWSFAIPGTGAPEFGVHGAPIEDADGRLYFGAQDDAVHALDRDGAAIFGFATGGDVDAPLVLARDGLLLAGSDDGKLYALGAR